MKRIYTLLLILMAGLLLVPEAFAASATRYQEVVRDRRGNAIGSATVYVYNANTSTLATVYTSSLMTTARSQPFTSDSNGRFWFYASDGTYDIAVSRSGITDYTLEDVRILQDDLTVGYNVKAYGVKGDGSTDDTAAIQAAVDTMASRGSGALYFPTGEYMAAGVTIDAGDLTILGDGPEATLISGPSGTLVPLFTISGDTTGTEIDRVKFKDIGFRNGTAGQFHSQGAVYAEMSGLSFRYVEDVEIENCKFSEIQGRAGVVMEDTKDVLISGCTFYRVAYSGTSIHPDCENITIDNCTYDTNTQDPYVSPVYLAVCTDYDTTWAEDTAWVDGYTFTNNVIRNNPYWEGIDLHGGSNILISNNFIENCYVGILAAVDSLTEGSYRTVVTPRLDNLVITGNTIIHNPTLSKSGIIVKGNDAATAQPYSATPPVIANNFIDGFGADGEMTQTRWGAITAYNLPGVVITGNVITNFHQSGIGLYTAIDNITITNNFFMTPARNGINHADSTKVAAVYLRDAAAGTKIRDIIFMGNQVYDPFHELGFVVFGTAGITYDGYITSFGNHNSWDFNGEPSTSRTPLSGFTVADDDPEDYAYMTPGSLYHDTDDELLFAKRGTLDDGWSEVQTAGYMYLAYEGAGYTQASAIGTYTQLSGTMTVQYADSTFALHGASGILHRHEKTGRYMVEWSVSLESSASGNEAYLICPWISATPLPHWGQSTEWSGTDESGQRKNVGGSFIIELDQGEVLALAISGLVGSTDPTIEDCTMTIHRVGF